MLPSPELQHARRQPASPVTAMPPAPADASHAAPEQVIVLSLMARGTDLEAAWLITAGSVEPLPLASASKDATSLEAAVARCQADATLVCFVESPGRALARLADAGAADDAAAVLQRWARGATAMLRLRHRAAHRAVMIDTADLERSEAEVRARLDSQWAAGAAAGVIGRPGAPEPLAECVANAVASRQPGIVRLWAEVQVSCEPIGAEVAAATRDDSLAAVALADYRQRAQERAALSARLQAAEDRIAAGHTELAETHASLAAARSARIELQEALELEQLRLQQALEEIRVLAERARSAEEGLARVQAADARTRTSLQSELSALQNTQRAQRDSLKLLRWAHRSAAGLPLIEPLVCRELTIVRSRDDAPYRELVVELRDVDTPMGMLDGLQVRLVEHNGHPGLALFVTAGQPALRQWSPDGEEAGRAFTLLIPEDDGATARLRCLGSADWRFVLAMVQRLRGELADEGSLQRSRWRAIATRLHLALHNLPARWRYNTLEARVEATPKEDAPALRMTFGDVCYGCEPLGDVDVLWVGSKAADGLRTGGPALEWLRTRGLPPPLSAWPVEGDGEWSATLRLPLGRAFATEAKYRWWSTLAAGDRLLLLGLLDALPAAAALSAVRDAAPAFTPQDASTLQREARRLIARQRLRQAMRRAMRRTDVRSA